MAEVDTRKPDLLADWRNTMNSYRYILVQIYSFQPLYNTHWLTLSLATRRQCLHRLSLADMVHRPAKILYLKGRQVKGSVRLIRHRAMKTFWARRGMAPRVLNNGIIRE
jgi:hypothetical protein